MALLKMKRDGKMVAVRLDREAVIVGSSQACNIKVPDGGLAPRHCQILRMNNGFVLRDLSGEVGTFINGKKVKEHLLSDRDVIQMGNERFTYAESEGENTARVAVSAGTPATARASAASPGTQKMVPAAAPAAKAPERGTSRVAVDPTRKTTARAVAQPEAPPPPTGRKSGPMPKSGTQRLGPPVKGRMPTGRTGRITTSTETFSMPKTRKGKIIAACVALGILGLGGVMTMVLMNQDNPKEIKAELDARWKDVSVKLKDAPVKLKVEIDDILGNVKYKKYGAETFAAVKKSKPAVDQAAKDQQDADKEVSPFIAKYEVAKSNPEKWAAEANNLYEEAKALLTRYQSSNYGPKLTSIRDEAFQTLEKASAAGDYKLPLVNLGRDVENKITKEGDCKGALGLVNEFGVKWKEETVGDLFNKLRDLRERIKRGSEEVVKKRNTEAQKLVADGKKPDAQKLLEGSRAGLEGFPPALEKLEAAIKGLK